MFALIIVIIAVLAGAIALIAASMTRDKKIRTSAGITGGVAFAVALVVFVASSIAIVPNGNVAVMTRFQKTTGQILSNGLNWKSIIDTPVVMSIQTQKYEVPCEAASRDLQDVETTIAINYKLDGQVANDVYRTVGVRYFQVIGEPAIQEVVKSVVAQYNAEDMILKRETVKDAITKALEQRLAERGIISEAINITNFDFSKEFTAAIEAKVSAAQAVLQAQNKLEQAKVEAQQAEAVAKGKASAVIAEAEGQARAIAIVTEAQVKANKDIESSLTDEVLRYIFIDRLGADVKVWVIPDGQAFTINPPN